MTDEKRVRHSKAETIVVAKDDVEKAKLEAKNGLEQTEEVRQLVLQAVDGRPFRLRPSTILGLNRIAIKGLNSYAGNWRPAGIEIGQSKHEPPGGHLVPELVEQMCDYVNDNWSEKTAVHLAAFSMWRLNWIHPFTDGNGRTSRAVSYLVLCAKTGYLLPGVETIPEQIVSNRAPYYGALEKADERFKSSETFTDDIVSEMEELLGAMLARQLRSAFDEAVNGREEHMLTHPSSTPK
jgi:Fic family protein